MKNEVIKYTTKCDIERSNIEYLPELFLCEDDTPLQSPPLLEEFGYIGNTCAGDKVTVGTYIPPPDTDEYTKLFLECFKHPPHIPEKTIKDSFSTSDYVKCWKSRREKTSSSRSGRHFGHYKIQFKQ